MTPPTWDGFEAGALATRLGVPRVDLHGEVTSTQDVAHRLAEQGAAAGTVVLADAQRVGRGRHGRAWASGAGQGVWCTVIERPGEPRALDVLSLRVGLLLAEALEPLAGEPVGVKWPNDLRLRDGKVAGILVESRWAGPSPAWAAIGVGVNVRPPDLPDAAGLPPGVSRVQVLDAVVGAVRAAAARSEWLTGAEVERYRARDVLAGRRISSPAAGVVLGIAASGALVVRTEQGIAEHRAGTIQLVEEP